MSLAENLLNSIPEPIASVFGIGPDVEPHIVINPDRTVKVPDDLKHVAVEDDHNIETVTFDCPRYWDGHDLSEMQLRIVFQRSDGYRDSHPVENLCVDVDDEAVIHFDWTISGNVTAVRGNISFTVCGKLSNTEGVREREWHTRLNQDLIVDEGMDCSNDEIVERNPDIIEAILVQLDELKSTGGGSGGTPDAVQFVPQELTAEQQEQARKNIGAADAETLLPLTESQTVTSVNLYDPSLQTEDTISPHYWVNGAPYPTTQFDGSYHCTAPIPVEPNTTYTVVVLLGDGTTKKPWYESVQGAHFFKADGTFISKTAENTFTTPAETAYFRMNYAYGLGVGLGLPSLNARCMLVKGDTLPETYSGFGSYTTSSAINRLSRYSPPIQYHINNNTLKVSSPYSAEKDLLVTMNLGRGNGLFDFASFKLMPHGLGIADGESQAETLATNGTDWHAPFIVRATDNADGDDIESAYFTGGNHQYNNQGSGSSATARSLSLRFFVDGREVVSEKGYANKIEVRWANNVQGYNTRKADGTGREILQERHRLIFDGVKWSETIELEPLEDVFMALWYGLQFVYSTVYPNYRYIGAADRTLHTGGGSDCGGKDADGIIAYGDEHMVEMTIDTSVDLGKRALSGETGALCSNGKAYMFIIDYRQMDAGAVYRLCGGYRFMPA